MLKQVIKGWNAAPGAPAGWDPAKDGECVALPVRVFPPNAINGPWENRPTVQYCESAWEPTPQELEYLNNGGKLILRIVGWQVPVALYVEPPEQEQANDVG
jgi:hypothetical protein